MNSGWELPIRPITCKSCDKVPADSPPCAIQRQACRARACAGGVSGISSVNSLRNPRTHIRHRGRAAESRGRPRQRRGLQPGFPRIPLGRQRGRGTARLRPRARPREDTSESLFQRAGRCRQGAVGSGGLQPHIPAGILDCGKGDGSIRERQSLSTVGGRGIMVRLREELMPVFCLYRLFNVKGAIEDPLKGLLVVVGDGTRR